MLIFIKNHGFFLAHLYFDRYNFTVKFPFFLSLACALLADSRPSVLFLSGHIILIGNILSCNTHVAARKRIRQSRNQSILQLSMSHTVPVPGLSQIKRNIRHTFTSACHSNLTHTTFDFLSSCDDSL